MRRVLLKWWLTIFLFAGYLATFHLWMGRGPGFVFVAGITSTVLLTGLLVLGMRTRYFADRMDLFTHAAVVLDVLLEGTLLTEHLTHGFYFCAIAFGVVVGVYRQTHLPLTNAVIPDTQ